MKTAKRSRTPVRTINIYTQPANIRISVEQQEFLQRENITTSEAIRACIDAAIEADRKAKKPSGAIIREYVRAILDQPQTLTYVKSRVETQGFGRSEAHDVVERMVEAGELAYTLIGQNVYVERVGGDV